MESQTYLFHLPHIKQVFAICVLCRIFSQLMLSLSDEFNINAECDTVPPILKAADHVGAVGKTNGSLGFGFKVCLKQYITSLQISLIT